MYLLPTGNVWKLSNDKFIHGFWIILKFWTLADIIDNFRMDKSKIKLTNIIQIYLWLMTKYRYKYTIIYYCLFL